jgi:hypothetical protein
LKVLFTPTGRRQFIEAIAYIYRDNPSAAVDFRRKFIRLPPKVVYFDSSQTDFITFEEALNSIEELEPTGRKERPASGYSFMFALNRR